MKKKIPAKIYICQSCGENFPRWSGKCPGCESWNTIIEETGSGSKFTEKKRTILDPKRYEDPISINKIEEEKFQRIKTGFSELDLVLGGGIVPGSLVLIGGEPGVGKSTLILEVAKNLSNKDKVLYISGEESASQIGLRAKRLGIQSDNILLSSEGYAENIIQMIEHIRPGVVFIDSIQTVQREALPNQAGTVTQLRECTQIFLETSKRLSIPIFLIGHITKEGLIAGPKVLEHLVDTVLYFEGDKLNYYRILRAVKNRFGSVGDIAVFEMKTSGLEEVINRNDLFLFRDADTQEGSVLSVVLEGSRALSVEVQALVAKTSFSQARRMSEGLDNKRLILLCAVIEKYLGIPLSQSDVFANLAGGLTVDEPSLDLAICSAILSSATNRSVSSTTAFLGEVGLSGEVRNVGQLGLRLKELEAIGLEKVILPVSAKNEWKKENSGFQLIGIKHLRELTEYFD
ncbi:DNA repair protein RadA [Leptospira sp. GIMC2001]|uniref:DNA repair protein RadA n=1 Tax=Leptospira sp. GIMC2001 TaxID=1513297 RepID=UPI002349D8A0|nr:DNA repair protein RadA [Leptospira sp. GIMC2001]WCL48233.1 DNA repair protein RadA [Leptospira sp. GIMC2001]